MGIQGLLPTGGDGKMDKCENKKCPDNDDWCSKGCRSISMSMSIGHCPDYLTTKKDPSAESPACNVGL
jgi:hypothetical protein